VTPEPRWREDALSGVRHIDCRNGKWGSASLLAPIPRPHRPSCFAIAPALRTRCAIAGYRRPFAIVCRALLFVAPVQMPSGARSPWAAADPCFRTSPRRYLSIRPLTSACAEHGPSSTISRLPQAAFASGLKKPFVGVTSASWPRSRSCLHTPGRTPAGEGGMPAVTLPNLLHAGSKPKLLPRLLA
jgi:hypothetical protein